MNEPTIRIASTVCSRLLGDVERLARDTFASQGYEIVRVISIADRGFSDRGPRTWTVDAECTRRAER